MPHRYWTFYWPLALMGLVSLLAGQFQNGVLARYPNAAQELAVFAMASSTFNLFCSALWFMPQVVNALARSPQGLVVIFRFVLLLSSALSLPLLFLAFTPAGETVLAAGFGIRDDLLRPVVVYLRLLTPLVFVNGLRFYYSGLLIQCKRTGLVTVLNVTEMGSVIILLVAGFGRGWLPLWTVALAQIVSSVLYLALGYVLFRRHYCAPPSGAHTDPSYREVWDFFWPVAITSVMFSLSRPLIYSFLNRLPDPAPTIAVLRVGFDFALIFHDPLNQFRHLFITFGRNEVAAVRKFMQRVTLWVVGVMVVIAATPLSTLLFSRLLGLDNMLTIMARQTLWVLVFIPIAISFRNYYHGLAMVERRTAGMALGSVMRISAIFLSAAGLLAAGRLNHVTAAATLLLGFMAETVTMYLSLRHAGHEKI